MKLERGTSKETDTSNVVEELVGSWSSDYKPGLLLLYCSTKQNSAEIAAELGKRYPDALMTGCTTSGEMLDGKHYRDSAILMGIDAPDITWCIRRVEGLADFDSQKAEEVSSELFAGIGVDRNEFDQSKCFCLDFIDGLSMAEEQVMSIMAESLEGVQLVGGSAGDDLALKKTEVVFNGESKSDTAVFLMGKTDRPFTIFKHQHFNTTPKSMVVTKADAAKRIVYEFDGYPATEAYAKTLGLPLEECKSAFILNPLTFTCNGEIYVRVVQAFNDDGSMGFYCAIEEGMVVRFGGHEDMTPALSNSMSELKDSLGHSDLIIGWDCIFRALEADKDLPEQVAVIKEATNGYIGYNTYGEQLNGVHINQTLVGIAFKSVG